MNREAWHAVIYGVTKSQTRLRDWTELKQTKFTLYFLTESLFPYLLKIWKLPLSPRFLPLTEVCDSNY